MQLKTKHFGLLEIDEKGILNFDDGLPGFEQIKKYILIGTGDDQSPFRWLQSIDEPNLAFAVVDPFVIKKDYDIDLNSEVLDSLDIESEKDVLVYSIVVVPEDTTKMTMNLKAPLIINVKNHKGVQVILDTDKYSVRHYILEELRRQEVAEDACSNKEEKPVNCNK